MISSSNLFFQCTDKDGEEFCLTKIDKCDKPNIIERCEKTCGQCPTTVPVSTTIEADITTTPSNNETTTATITSTVDEDTTTDDGEGSTTPFVETTPDPVSEVY